MCCFSKPVKKVANTSIFARVSDRGNQVIIYSMSLDAPEDLAMILPIPIKKGTAENGIQFINLEKYPHLFKEIDALFPEPASLSRWSDSKDGKNAPRLKVEKVGNFEASFVPSVDDFHRLDERFRIEKKIWQKRPEYADFGFAVFKLKEGAAKIHPMAFSFPTATPESIFFPTLHIHDGEIHPKEKFDHSLYCQTKSQEIAMTWRESQSPPQAAISKKAKMTILPDEHVYKKQMIGRFENTDVTISAI